jgi:hypothetical protein
MAEQRHRESRSDSPSKPSELATDELLRATIAAPSMHNTQPWRLCVANSGTTIEIFVDPDRMLTVSDPHGRAAYIGCGAALLNLRVAAAAIGLRADVALTPDPGQPLFVARVELSGGYRPTPWDQELSAAIWRRCSNREPYGDDVLPTAVQRELVQAATSEQGILHFLDENEASQVRQLVTSAERELLADPAYRAELARWVSRDRFDDGIPPWALGPRSSVGRDPVRDFEPDRSQPVRYAEFEYSPQLAVLSVRAHSLRRWVEAGQALERVWLTATCRGISFCPLTQPLETSDAWRVGDGRWGSGYPQMIMRVGYGPPVRTSSPRRAISDVTSLE